MKYGVVIFPCKRLQDIANSYRKRYDPNFANIPPHIPLIKDGFEADEQEITKIISTFRRLSNKIKPFPITITKYSSFKPVENIIYLKIDRKTELENLHKQITSSFLGKRSEHIYIPHITVAQKLSNDEHSDIYGSLNMIKLNIQDTIDCFHLVCQLENRSWVIHETFQFRKE